MTDPVRIIDLGHGHILKFFAWKPDDLPANREAYGEPLPRVDRAGATVTHPRIGGRPGDEPCLAGIYFDLPETAAMRDSGAKWKVEQWDPLTISPSLGCMLCGDHGFIRNGRWVPASNIQPHGKGVK